MSWFRRKKVAEIPLVPQDKHEREAALAQSKRALEMALATVDGVERLVSVLQEHEVANHYRDRLALAYGEKK